MMSFNSIPKSGWASLGLTSKNSWIPNLLYHLVTAALWGKKGLKLASAIAGFDPTAISVWKFEQGGALDLSAIQDLLLKLAIY